MLLQNLKYIEALLHVVNDILSAQDNDNISVLLFKVLQLSVLLITKFSSPSSALLLVL